MKWSNGNISYFPVTYISNYINIHIYLHVLVGGGTGAAISLTGFTCTGPTGITVGSGNEVWQSTHVYTYTYTQSERER